MNYFALSLGIVAGITFAFGILFLFIGLRHKDSRRLNLTFALFALSYAGATLFAINQYAVNSVAEYILASRLIGPFIVLGWISLIWYVSFYTEVQPRLFLLLLSIAFIAAGVVNTIGRYSIFEEVLGLTILTLPWDEQLAFGDVVEDSWFLVFLAAQVVALLYILIASFLQFRRGERRAALVLVFGLLWLIATIVVVNLGAFGVSNLFFPSDFGFLGLAIALSLKMANDVIRTEEELEGYRQELEELVGERTAELEGSNAKLVTEIDERQQAQTSLEQRIRELDTLHSIGTTLSNVTDLPAALRSAEELTTELFDAALAYIIVPSEMDDGVKIAVGYDRDFGSIGTRPLDLSVAGLASIRHVLNEGESLTMSEMKSLPLRPEMLEQLAERPLESVLLVPLVVRGMTTGLLAIGSDRAGRDFSAVDIALAETIAGDIARAIENARLHEGVQEAGALTGQTRIPVEVVVDGEGDVPAEVEVAFYRIAQEAFNNIAKHAGAERVKTLLRIGPDHAVLAIRDNGRGFNPESIDPERTGVQIMRERAASIGAQLLIRSQPGQGTRILLSWPDPEGQGYDAR
jgi:GAF domain-containing protein